MGLVSEEVQEKREENIKLIDVQLDILESLNKQSKILFAIRDNITTMHELLQVQTWDRKRKEGKKGGV